MDRILLDSGTAYSKLYHLEEGRYEILPNRTLKGLMHADQVVFDHRRSATCHTESLPSCHSESLPSCHSESLPSCHSESLPSCHSECSEESRPGIGSTRHSEDRDSSPPLHGPRGNLGSGPAPAQNDISRIHRRLTVVAATGHNASRFSDRLLNELLALAYGGLELVEEGDFVLVDCGARDIKMVRVEGRRVQEMNWNTECGAFCGQTVELLLGHFGLRADSITPAARPLAVTCGVLGMTQLFDLIAADVSPEEALARFVRGIAENVQRFAGRPERFYLSGGFCDNRLFLDSMDCQVVPLGRFVLLEGLRADLARTAPEQCGVGP